MENKFGGKYRQMPTLSNMVIPIYIYDILYLEEPYAKLFKMFCSILNNCTIFLSKNVTYKYINIGWYIGTLYGFI